jgi:hypothetical protein
MSVVRTTYTGSSRKGDKNVETEEIDLDVKQKEYLAAVEEWIAGIKSEEALASVPHTVAAIDSWEAAGFREEELRDKAKAAKKEYEDALRERFFSF